IEGVVLRKETINGDELWKLVDREIFTVVNSFNHEVREKVVKKHQSINADNSKAGVMGNMLRDMASSIGYPEIGTTQAKKYLKTISFNPNDIFEYLSRDIDIQRIKNQWEKIITKHYKILGNLLTQYMEQYE